MSSGQFLINGNICAARMKLGLALQKPPMAQEDPARKLNIMDADVTPLMISRIEKKQRHVCDAELFMPARVLNVSMKWLC